MKIPGIPACITALALLTTTTATTQVYLSDYLTVAGGPCTAFGGPNLPFNTVLEWGGQGIGVDTAHAYSDCQPIVFRRRAPFLKGIGMRPDAFRPNPAVAFDLDAIRAVALQPLDVFEATVGIYSRQGQTGAQFRVYLDGGLRESVDIQDVDDHAVTLRIPITNASTLRLETSAIGPINDNQACWGDAKLVSSRSHILAWGSNANGQNEVPAPPSLVKVCAGQGTDLVGIRSDGSLAVWVLNSYALPTPDPGVGFVDVAQFPTSVQGLYTDGTIRAVGQTSWGLLNVPALPAGVTYVDMAQGNLFMLALRSDGEVVGWGFDQVGETTAPTLPAGVTFTKLAAGATKSLGLRSDGQIETWGGGSYGFYNVPALPAGVTYVDIAMGSDHAVALRSDGQIATWGDNLSGNGQLNVPPLPPGVTWVEIDANGDLTVARRSDGQVLAWGQGFNSEMSNVPTLPAGRQIVEISVGFHHVLARLDDGSMVSWPEPAFPVPDAVLPIYTQVDGSANHVLALRSDGLIDAWGNSADGKLDVPPLPYGETYTKVAAGLQHSLALRSDGEVLGWGFNGMNQISVPALPTGVTYTDISSGFDHAIALRSDGAAVGWGSSQSGQLAIPGLAPGLTWSRIECCNGQFWTMGLVSDGTLRAWGSDIFGQISSLPGGSDFVEIATGVSFGLAQRQDGSVVAWGDTGAGQTTLPPLPPGVTLASFAAGFSNALALRSDGELVAWGSNNQAQANVAPTFAGGEYVAISAGNNNSWAIAERRTRLQSHGAGCAFEGVPAVIYEEFPQIQNSDIAGTTINWLRSADGYDVTNAINGTFVTPPGSATVVAGGALDGQQQFTLTTPMPVPGGITTILNVTTKGQVEIGGASSATIDFSPTVAELRNNPRTVFACWSDYDQTFSGDITFHEAGGVAYATWNNIESYSSPNVLTGLSRFQFQFVLATGDVRLVHELTPTLAIQNLIIGFSQAGPASDPGATDLTAPFLFQQVFDNTDALTLTGIGEPKLGNTSFAVEVANVPPLVPFAFLAYSTTAFPAGVDLTAVGMPGCFAYVTPDLLLTLSVDPATGIGSYPFPIASNPALLGKTRACQALAFSPATPLNLITSNGIEFTIGY